MRGYRRIGLAAAAGVAALGLAACGLPGSTTATGSTGDSGSGSGSGSGDAIAAAGETAVEVAAELSPEGRALVALGFDPASATPTSDPSPDPSPDPSASPSAGKGKARPGPRKRGTARVLLRRNTLHGEVVVQDKDGATKTVVVQRGTVTAIDDTTITVKSTDGFSLTWTFGDPLRVVERRSTVQPKDVAVGARVGVAGAKDGDRAVARLVLVNSA